MKHLELAFRDGLATVTLNRPQVRNAFDEDVIAELGAVFHELGQRTEVRAVVLAANGPAFCAGADLQWMRRMAAFNRDQNIDDASALARMLELIWRCPRPTIARVHGDVYAGGMGLVAACDIAVAADAACFCLSEVRIGLIPATISPYVVRAMGIRAAHRYFLTGERFDAAEALRIGFVHEVVPAAGLDAAVARVAGSLLQAGPQALRSCKKLLQDVAGQEISPALVQRTVEGIADSRSGEEGREGVQAFLDKRKPNWAS
ncbi:enoyl-CoA hydratase/isomerase family protein [Ramlibacter sp. AW1]|uniref:Enoyl-CoA hydratase/isomerase family protein n=1 Tax=Ramlibacter aurantiacus TaxID=2801330 RepID=A0A937D785_9BURK|nr:enoyl-CoA hydratase/isomerase family protein [Ramlibacter aurantiacus]MBL0421748.1 enoyl-CoA hydratase/isomerase family protein [Ramlibacter aurantiacus]